MDSSSWKPGLKRGQLVSLMQDLPEISKLSCLIHFLLQQGLSDTSCVLVGNVLDAPHRRDRFLIGLMLVRGGWSSMILGVLSTIVQRGGSRHSVFNDHVKALWGAQNIRGKKTFLSNNSWLEVGGLAPLTYTVNCKIFAYAGLFGACKQCYQATGSMPTVLGTQRITFLHPPLACSLTCEACGCFISKVSKVGPHNTYPEHAHAADEAYHILAGKTSLL